MGSGEHFAPMPSLPPLPTPQICSPRGMRESVETKKESFKSSGLRTWGQNARARDREPTLGRRTRKKAEESCT